MRLLSSKEIGYPCTRNKCTVVIEHTVHAIEESIMYEECRDVWSSY